MLADGNTVEERPFRAALVLHQSDGLQPRGGPWVILKPDTWELKARSLKLMLSDTAILTHIARQPKR